jgi:hypothetical protein
MAISWVPFLLICMLSSLILASIGAVAWFRTRRREFAVGVTGLGLYPASAILFAVSIPDAVLSTAIASGFVVAWIVENRQRLRSNDQQCVLRPRLSAIPFSVAMSCLLAGGVAFVAGIGAAFGRAGEWADRLACLGVILLVIAGLLNTQACEAAWLCLLREKKFHWWLPLSSIAAIGTIYSLWVVVRI